MEAKKKFNMAQLSDLHYSADDKKGDETREKILELLDQNSVDYISFPGDLMDSVVYADDILLKWVERAAKNRKFFIVKGNHDQLCREAGEWVPSDCESFWNELSSIEGVEYNPDVLKYEDDNIIVRGINLPAEYYENDVRTENEDLFVKYMNEGTMDLKTICSKKLRFLLVHSPLYLTSPSVEDYIAKVDEIIAGHMHNGGVPHPFDTLIPGNRGLVGPLSKILPPNSRGMIKRMSIIEEPGTTSINKHITNIRICGGVNKWSYSSGLTIARPLYPADVTIVAYKTNANITCEEAKVKTYHLRYR